VMAGLVSDGMADSEPLSRLVASYVNADFLAEIARAHRAGRSLLIGTTDLDSGRAVTWDMGAIAASGAPGALELFRKILVASTSVPGAVSPVMIDVEANGKHYQEMHADGGVRAQVFLYPSHSLEELSKATGKPFRRELHSYVIRNGRVEPEWLQSKRRTLGIGARAIGMLIQTQGISDLSRLYLTAKQDGADFNLAYIDSGFTYAHESEFNTEYMRRLFEYGYQRASGGYPWRKTPPGD
jgi:predicted acylesterase/phospholipase RssA